MKEKREAAKKPKSFVGGFASYIADQEDDMAIAMDSTSATITNKTPAKKAPTKDYGLSSPEDGLSSPEEKID